jgi:hypothetical protein
MTGRRWSPARAIPLGAGSRIVNPATLGFIPPFDFGAKGKGGSIQSAAALLSDQEAKSLLTHPYT